MKKQMSESRKQEIRNETETVGMLPNGGDDKTFNNHCCECCGEKKETRLWEGCDIAGAYLCDDCFASLN